MGRDAFGECGRDHELSYPEYGFHATILPRKWPLSFILQEIGEDREQHNADKSEHPYCINIKTCPLPLKPIYSGDRFIPRRCSYSFEMAHHILMKNDTTEDTQTLDVCEQISLLQDTYRRKAMRARMKQVLFPELNQGKILSFTGLMVRPRDPPRSECEKGSWKCMPRKKVLIGSADTMLSIPDDSPLLNDNNTVRNVAWSCNDMIATTNYDCLCIYDTNGEEVSSYKISTVFDYGDLCITDIKWSNDGTKLIMTAFSTEVNPSTLQMYELKNKKILWNVIYEACPYIFIEGCVLNCACWSFNDREIVTACTNKISIFESNTGKLLHFKEDPQFDILNLSFSPNFKCLISTSLNEIVRGFAWPELTPCFNIKFREQVRAFAWHPQEFDLLCIGGNNGSLSVWNVNKIAMTAFVRVKFNGWVQNLAWNKLSGELVVHWNYREGDKRYIIVAVLASFNQIVDVVPINKESELSFLKFNASHEKLITFCSDNVCSMWNFFGNKKSSQKEEKYKRSRQQRQGLMIHTIR